MARQKETVNGLVLLKCPTLSTMAALSAGAPECKKKTLVGQAYVVGKTCPSIEIGVIYGPKWVETRTEISIIHRYVPAALLCIEVSF